MHIIIDSHYLCHAAKYVLPELSYEDRRTGVIYGFLNRILSIAAEFRCRNFVFTWEGPDGVQLKRQALYPEYKNKPKNFSEEDIELEGLARPQFRILLENVLPSLGFHCQYFMEGYEADDIIAKIVYDNPDKELMIVSRDEDLYQLLEGSADFPGCYMYDPQTPPKNTPVKKRKFTAYDFVKKYGISPGLWVFVKAMAGCSSDNVIGIKGIGEATAIKFLNKELPMHYKAYKRIKAGTDIIERNRNLVELPFDDELPEYLVEEQDGFNMKSFVEICDGYSFRSFIIGKQYDVWKEVFVNNG